MKKALAAILAFLYLSSSIGAILHYHYCMGRLVSIGLLANESKNCSYCGMQKASPAEQNKVYKEECCRDVDRQLIIDKDQRPSNSNFHISKIVFAAHTGDFFTISSAVTLSSRTKDPTRCAPPLSTKRPAYLLNCTYRI